MPTLLQPSRRTLTPAEAAHLRERIRSSGGRRLTNLVIAGGLYVGLWLLSPWATDKQLWIATVIWLVIGAALVGWAYWDLRRQSKAAGHRFDAALRRNAADVFDIKATRFMAFEHLENEGATYAFELKDGRTVVVSGQDFHEHDAFPSRDFSIVHLLGEKDEIVDVLVESHGPKAAPAYVAPATAKTALEWPPHLTIMETPLAAIEDKLRQASPRPS